MAGEWLKMEASTPDKAEVLAITARLGWDDPDLTVGKLFRVWRWFDQQTIDGNARGVTKALLDRQIGVTGFCDAMESVGWMVVDETGIRLPNFDRHNGSTAKNRALTAKRVANHKANKQGNGVSVSDALPREEKKREEKKDTDHVSKDNSKRNSTDLSSASRSTGTRLPDDWVLPKAWGDWVKTEFPRATDEEIRKEPKKFKDHWLSNANRREGKKADWLATWRNWIRRAFDGTGAATGDTKPWWQRGWSDIEKRGAELGLTQGENEQHHVFKERVFEAARAAGEDIPIGRLAT